MAKVLWAGMALLTAVAACAAPAGRPVYPCYRPAVAPVMDGKLAPEDPAWGGIPSVTGFSRLGDGFTLAKQTVVQACWDDAALYVGVVCEEPDAALLRPQMTDGGDFWMEDSIELFVQPGPSAQVFQFGVTPSGAKGGHEGYPDITKLTTAARVGPDFYCLEVRIPFEALRTGRPKLGDQWLAGFCRNITTTNSGGDHFTCWPPLQTAFLEPEHFATLGFMGPAPGATEAGRLSESLCTAYRADLAARLRVAAQQGRQYTKVLTQAGSDKQFGAQARELLAQWRQVESLQRNASVAGTREMRRALVSVNALARQSYDTQYAYLIARLFADE